MRPEYKKGPLNNAQRGPLHLRGYTAVTNERFKDLVAEWVALEAFGVCISNQKGCPSIPLYPNYANTII